MYSFSIFAVRFLYLLVYGDIVAGCTFGPNSWDIFIVSSGSWLCLDLCLYDVWNYPATSHLNALSIILFIWTIYWFWTVICPWDFWDVCLWIENLDILHFLLVFVCLLDVDFWVWCKGGYQIAGKAILAWDLCFLYLIISRLILFTNSRVAISILLVIFAKMNDFSQIN